jgi:hypothetical protein
MDPLIAAFQREQRLRTILVVAVVVGILAGALCGMAASLGAFGFGFGGPRSPAGLIFFIGPFAAAMTLGYAVHSVTRRIVLGYW